MTVKGLIKKLEKIDDDKIVVIGDFEGAGKDSNGWCNIAYAKEGKSTVSILGDYTRPFSSDN